MHRKPPGFSRPVIRLLAVLVVALGGVAALLPIIGDDTGDGQSYTAAEVAAARKESAGTSRSAERAEQVPAELTEALNTQVTVSAAEEQRKVEERAAAEAAARKKAAEEAARKKAEEEAARKAAEEEAARKAAEEEAAREAAEEEAAREEAEREESDEGDESGGQSDGWVAPVSGYRITATFGSSGSRWSSTHTGLDFAAPSGTEVRSVGAGTVISAEWDGAFGNKIEVEHTDGTITWYAHLSGYVASVGTEVSAGEAIGRVGSTGNSTGPHLHLEVHPGGGDAVDPRSWLAERGVDV